ncbi:hypothetical protein [Kordiimonas gwangyangensis]|uniref:hypothetical protein n=1 Tax=Kordiimonas gwangyangensis TaxID=288022 RepID=UPI0012DE6BE9|nr:hypothetical protein [Kordiimonas gwangyangensis]
MRPLSRPNMVGGDLVADFWHQTGVDGSGLEVAKSRNVSFSAELANTLKESAYLFDNPHDNALTSYIDEQHKHRGGIKKPGLSAAQRRHIMAHFGPENDWLENTVFAGHDLSAWRAVPEEEDEAALAAKRARDLPSLQGWRNW